MMSLNPKRRAKTGSRKTSSRKSNPVAASGLAGEHYAWSGLLPNSGGGEFEVAESPHLLKGLGVDLGLSCG